MPFGLALELIELLGLSQWHCWKTVAACQLNDWVTRRDEPSADGRRLINLRVTVASRK